MIESIKLITTTRSGTQLKVPAKIERIDDRIFFVDSPFQLKDEIKAMKGSKWHGYIPGDGRKVWSADDCCRNNFQLDFMMGGNPYANWDQPLKNYGYTRPLFDHQKLMSDHCLTYHYKILAAEMGCISGDAVVQVYRPRKNGGAKKKRMTLRELFSRTEGINTGEGNCWCSDTPTYIQALTDKGFEYTGVVKVLSKGVKKVIKVTLEDGRHLVLTENHEVYTSWRSRKAASSLIPGDTVVVTGTEKSKHKLHQNKTPKWNGEKVTKLGSWCRLNSEGYVEVGSFDAFPVGWTTKEGKKVVKEQYLVLFEHLGFVPATFVIHHINGVKHDNRIENLALLKPEGHRHIHSFDHVKKPRGWEPCVGVVASVESFGESDVYDIVCDHPHHNFVADGMVVRNCGKTLSAIEVMEKSGTDDFWWVGPKSAIAAVELEFEKWNLQIQPRMMTYDRLRIEMERWTPGSPAPRGVIFDESPRMKTATSKRTKAGAHLADNIRAEHGWDGYVILMTGSPAAKSPVNWWAQSEICYPGFLKEGNVKAFEWRLAIFEKQITASGEFWKRKSWRDDERKCDKCGEYENHKIHIVGGMDEMFGGCEDNHEFVPSKNEVSYLYERLDGLVLPLAKKDCLDIPEKIYRAIELEPTSTIKRVGKALAKSAISAIQGLTWLRELSDGFQYSQVQSEKEPLVTCPVCKGAKKVEQWFNIHTDELAHIDSTLAVDEDNYEQRMDTCPRCEGVGDIPNMIRETKEIRCPKDQACRDLLEENEDQGRLVFFAGFQGSVDRVVNICHKQQWDVVKVDGRGWKILPCDGEKPPKNVKPLSYWANLDNERVAFVAHPESGGTGLTLTESRMVVFYSNDFKPENRIQAEDRIHRPGMDENKGATIVDLFHLGTDRKVLNVLRDNRRLEQMTLGEMKDMLE